jgi:tetratricopeptide (TPR) repeat protein
MLRPKKKITKRELKQDALITSYANFTAWYAGHKKQVGTVLTVAVVVVLGVVVYLNNQATNNEKASTDLAKVYSFFDGGQYQQAIDGIPERNIPGLKSIVENYGGTRSGDMARFYLASAYYSMGKYDDALEQFEDTGDLGPRLGVARLSGMAGCYEARQKYSEAGEYYEKAATAYADDINAAENLNNAARSYASAGNKEKALELYKKLKKSYPTTSFGREADRFISQLSV